MTKASNATSANGVEKIGHRQLLIPVVLGNVRNALTERREFRYRTIRELWQVAKRGSSQVVRSIDPIDIRGIDSLTLRAYPDDFNRVMVTAICSLVGCESFFEIGTSNGKTSWMVANNIPTASVYTLDFPSIEAADEAELELTREHFFDVYDKGSSFANTPEKDRIDQLFGDSATFDFSPYRGKIDVVFVDGSHTYSYVKSDTKRAFEMLRRGGTVIWDDYPGHSGVYALLHEIAPTLSHPLWHIAGTRLVVHTETELFTKGQN